MAGSDDRAGPRHRHRNRNATRMPAACDPRKGRDLGSRRDRVCPTIPVRPAKRREPQVKAHDETRHRSTRHHPRARRGVGAKENALARFEFLTLPSAEPKFPRSSSAVLHEQCAPRPPRRSRAGRSPLLRSPLRRCHRIPCPVQFHYTRIRPPTIRGSSGTLTLRPSAGPGDVVSPASDLPAILAGHFRRRRRATTLTPPEARSPWKRSPRPSSPPPRHSTCSD
jgi:hypothetical protein